MNIPKVIGLLLVVVGALALAYGGFSYVSDTHSANIGPLHLQINEHKQVNIPLWAGVVSVVGGVLILAFGRR